MSLGLALIYFLLCQRLPLVPCRGVWRHAPHGALAVNVRHGFKVGVAWLSGFTLLYVAGLVAGGRIFVLTDVFLGLFVLVFALHLVLTRTDSTCLFEATETSPVPREGEYLVLATEPELASWRAERPGMKCEFGPVPCLAVVEGGLIPADMEAIRVNGTGSGFLESLHDLRRLADRQGEELLDARRKVGDLTAKVETLLGEKQSLEDGVVKLNEALSRARMRSRSGDYPDRESEIHALLQRLAELQPAPSSIPPQRTLLPDSHS